jgi:hypothetical protein
VILAAFIPAFRTLRAPNEAVHETIVTPGSDHPIAKRNARVDVRSGRICSARCMRPACAPERWLGRKRTWNCLRVAARLL